MKTLLILRHAKSSWKDMTLPDHDRPLNKRGERDAPRMGRWLRRQGLVPDRIISSTARRAITTARAVALETECIEPVVATRDLYHAYPAEYVAQLQTVDAAAEIVLVVGHNPGMEELVAELTGAYEVMPTATVAQVALPLDDWAEMTDATTGELKAIWRPKELADG